MRLIIVLVAMSGLLAAAPAGQQPGMGDDPWRFVHPQAKWILGVDWARARNSAAAQILKRQFAGAESQVKTSGFGLSAVVSLDRIIASGISMDAAGGEAPQGLVVAIEGKLDRGLLRKELPPGTAVEKFLGADLYVPPKANPKEPLLAVVGDSLMLMGERAALKLILSGKGGARDADLYGRAARLASSSDIWMVASTPPDSPVKGQQDLLSNLKQVELGVSLQEGLRLTALLAADSAESAQNLAGLMQFAGAFGGDDAASAWMRRLQVKMKGEELAMTLDIPAKELEEGIEAGKGMVMQAGRQALDSWLGAEPGAAPAGIRPAARGTGIAGNAGGVVTLPAAEPEPKVRTIRITGAEEGPKEIQYTAPGRRPGQ
jgi:hypothetical protein